MQASEQSEWTHTRTNTLMNGHRKPHRDKWLQWTNTGIAAISSKLQKLDANHEVTIGERRKGWNERTHRQTCTSCEHKGKHYSKRKGKYANLKIQKRETERERESTTAVC